MSFDHKTFEFDWQAFSAEMLPWLNDVLAANRKTGTDLFSIFPRSARPAHFNSNTGSSLNLANESISYRQLVAFYRHPD